jgi:hypothetical protein
VQAYFPPVLVHHAQQAGLNVEPHPPQLPPPEELLLSVSLHVNEDKVKLCEPAATASNTTTFSGALDIRAAEKADDPLRA